jgi:hypothetical protein
MSHFAKIQNGTVVDIIVAEQAFIDSLPDAGAWLQTSIRTAGNTHPEGQPLRGNYARIGGVYDTVNDVFYDQQPFPSWSLNTTTWTWTPPQAYPRDGHIYAWDESTLSWKQ